MKRMVHWLILAGVISVMIPTFSNVSVGQGCVLEKVESVVQWCVAQCGARDGYRRCAGSGQMGLAARDADIGRVQLGYNDCYFDQSSERANMTSCAKEKSSETINIMREIYGYPLITPPPPPPTLSANCLCLSFSPLNIGPILQCVPRGSCGSSCSTNC